MSMNTLPAELVNAASLKSKVPAGVVTRKYFEDAGRTEFKDALKREGTEFERYAKVIEQCENHEDFEIYIKAFRKEALIHLAKQLGIKDFDPTKGEKGWPDNLKQSYTYRFAPQYQRMRRIALGFEANGKGWLLDKVARKGMTISQKIAEMPKLHATRGAQSHKKVKAPEVKDSGVLPDGTKEELSGALPAKAEAPKSATFKAILDGIEVLHNDFIPTLLLAVKARCTASNVPEWQMVAREIGAQMDKYDNRTGDADTAIAKANAKAEKEDAEVTAPEPAEKAA